MDIERKGEACDGNLKNKTDDSSTIAPPQNETYGWSRRDIQKDVEGEIVWNQVKQFASSL